MANIEQAQFVPEGQSALVRHSSIQSEHNPKLSFVHTPPLLLPPSQAPRKRQRLLCRYKERNRYCTKSQLCLSGSINEHSDPRWMLSANDNGRWVAERYLVVLGANGERAFRFTYSRTGALGIAQIMPETYAHIVDPYPDANLIRDIDLGRVEMHNAIKASILVFDDHLAVVINGIDNAAPAYRVKRRQLFDAKSEEEIEEIRAAIYNGGPGKYVCATGSISQRVQETVDFVKKFRLIRNLSLFE